MIVSVILICYNQEEYIASVIESVLKQEVDFEFEFIIGNDCSTDKTGEIIEEYNKANSNIKFLNNKSNLGLMGNFIQCLKFAQGKYIATIDGDDLWIDKEKLATQVNILESNPEYGMVHTQFDELYCYPKFFGRRLVNSALGVKSENLHYTFIGILTGSYICSSTVCFRRDIIVTDLDFMERMENGFFKVEDKPIYLKIAQNHKVGYLKKSTAIYRIHEDSLSRFTNPQKRLDFINQSYQLLRYFAELKGVDTEIERKIEEIRNQSLSYHYYKLGDLPQFKSIYSKLLKRPFKTRIMYLILILNKFGLLKDVNILKK